jgi:hypothetical protein
MSPSVRSVLAVIERTSDYIYALVAEAVKAGVEEAGGQIEIFQYVFDQLSSVLAVPMPIPGWPRLYLRRYEHQ